MKILILADTHLPKKAKELPERVKQVLREVEMVVHAGDFQTVEVWESLQSFGVPVHGVYGNVDEEKLRTILPAKQVLLIHQFCIGIVHGHEGKGKTTPDRAFLEFWRGRGRCHPLWSLSYPFL